MKQSLDFVNQNPGDFRKKYSTCVTSDSPRSSIIKQNDGIKGLPRVLQGANISNLTMAKKSYRNQKRFMQVNKSAADDHVKPHMQQYLSPLEMQNPIHQNKPIESGAYNLDHTSQKETQMSGVPSRTTLRIEHKSQRIGAGKDEISSILPKNVKGH